MVTDNFVRDRLSYDATVELIRNSSPKWLFIHVEHSHRLVDNPHKTFECTGIIEVTKRSALRYLDSAFPREWRPRVLIHVSASDTCIFIGGGRYEPIPDDEQAALAH